MGAVVKLVTGEKATLELGGKTIELPVIEGSEGEKALDISKLRATTGLITIDHGFMNTGSCNSAITFLDGEKGILKYRGYPIEQLAEKTDFLETAYLLIYGDLPSREQYNWFKEKIVANNEVKKDLKAMIQSFPKGTHPMAVMSALTVSMSGFYPEYNEAKKEKWDALFGQMMAHFKNFAAMSFRVTTGKKIIDSSLQRMDYCTDFLNMMFYETPASYDADVAKALNVLLILHADHEQNCSTSTVRLVGSSEVNLYASLASGINALWGPLHGGANQAVIEMLEEIHAGGGDYKKFLNRAKDKNDTFRLMGFGHRVYKNFDPRAKIIKGACDTVLKKLGVKSPLLEIAKGLEETALKDSYFVERKLYPNVDFYSGIIYQALNIPANMFTVLFALGRLPGWMAQWKEMKESADTKIGRPRQIYVGETDRAVKPIDRR